MNAEQLKVIAEGMGYLTVFNPPNEVLIMSKVKIGFDYIEYNPATNAEQSWEGYKFLLDKGFVMAASEQDASYPIYLLGEFIGDGKTPQKAVCNALYKYFKEEL